MRCCLFLLIVSALMALVPARALAQAKRQPNVIVLLSDDQGWGDFSLHGNKNLSTPNLDRLARGGAQLKHFYVQPVCSPTRAEMLTGRYHPRTGVRGVSTGQERINLDETTLADLLRAARYRTGAFGKWHNGSQWPYHPNARGFQHYYGFTSGHWGEYYDPPLEENGKPVRGKGYIADDFTDKALAFIRANKDAPFFCYVAYNTPHSPFCVPDDDWNRFKNRRIEQRGADGAKENIEVTRCVLAMCENLDRNVGRLLQLLDELKLADDTIVVFFCDNGPNSTRWNGGMRGRKGTTDEGGVRSPCFIRWPGKIAPGTEVVPIAGAIDLLPTLTGLAGVKTKDPHAGAAKKLDGQDLSPLLLSTNDGKKIEWPERMIFSTFNGNVSVRTQKHRLDGMGRLYDMIADPGQTTDVAGKHPKEAERLIKAVAAWRAEVLPAKKDDRPFPVGYAEFPRTPLPARDGIPVGNVRRSANAPNCSYFTNWKSKDDAMTWNVDVHTAGMYRAEILYTCSAKDVGSTVELRFREASMRGKVAIAWDPRLIADQDRVPRKGESYLKEFRSLTLEPIRLEKGRGTLSLRAVEVVGEQVMDVRGIALTLVPTK
ncbi:MAG: arylsulfatase [Planctomycetes bacterium]|nr:arylsulfatase [Planctomycetota bacterium]